MRLLSVVAVVLITCMCCLLSCVDEERASESDSAKSIPEDKSMPKPEVSQLMNPCTVVEEDYEELNKDVIDTPLKTQIAIDYLISNPSSLDSLRTFLQNRYDEAMSLRGFQYHEAPTNVYLYVYTSEELQKSGMGQWVAMLQQGPNDTEPKISVNELVFESLSKPKEEKFGLTEEQRMHAWQDLVRAEDRAMAESDEQYPTDLKKSSELMRELEEKYKSEVKAKYSLTEEQWDEISLEAMEKAWPLPELDS